MSVHAKYSLKLRRQKFAVHGDDQRILNRAIMTWLISSVLQYIQYQLTHKHGTVAIKVDLKSYVEIFCLF